MTSQIFKALSLKWSPLFLATNCIFLPRCGFPRASHHIKKKKIPPALCLFLLELYSLTQKVSNQVIAQMPVVASARVFVKRIWVKNWLKPFPSVRPHLYVRAAFSTLSSRSERGTSCWSPLSFLTHPTWTCRVSPPSHRLTLVAVCSSTGCASHLGQRRWRDGCDGADALDRKARKCIEREAKSWPCMEVLLFS